MASDGLRHMGLDDILIDHLKPVNEGKPGCFPLYM